MAGVIRASKLVRVLRVYGFPLEFCALGLTTGSLGAFLVAVIVALFVAMLVKAGWYRDELDPESS